MPNNAPIQPGLIILHGNQLELLRDAVFEWLQQNPLNPLEPETFLVQSNGVAEWIKIAIAEQTQVCAATKVELPGRFLWGVYRAMLGRDQIPRSAALDLAPLVWRLMRLLPTLLAAPDFAPLRFFLADGAAERRLQLAQKVAGLFDLYQLYRADWLDDWAAGLNQLRAADNTVIALNDEQRWQAQLWRAILDDLPIEQREMGRLSTHQRFMSACLAGQESAAPLPRRVVLFGMSSLPRQTLEALSALSQRCQVIIAVPNPCQFYWGDLIEGRQLFKAHYKRQTLKNGVDLSQFALEELHLHAHPLLANWGRQGRDFVRMLDEFDQTQAQLERFGALRIDLFSEGNGAHLLGHIQAAIRDMLPVTEHAPIAIDAQDTSISFHICHSPQREVEVLHDRLLTLFADSQKAISNSNVGAPLKPRDVVVMVPDIDVFLPAIRAVFGQYNRFDARYIPFDIGDVKNRSINPILVALDWLLRLPQQRCQQSEVRDLMDVPALAHRFGFSADDVPLLSRWITDSGVRWGLDSAHRRGLGLGQTGEQNSWLFGVQRMLLGYASGANSHLGNIESYGEVAGLDAALAGSLAQLIEALIQWRGVLASAVTPAEWGERARQLLATFFDASNEADQLMLARIEQSLETWLSSCADAQFNEPIPLGVMREAWLGLMDVQTLNHRFVSGGVTFCTLMPMRAIPFKVVCLLGMNEGDFPRRTSQVDFDLLTLPNMARAGDRSRRDDDRYLMLEALLSARDKFIVSWVGRNIRDNSEQPPSVLVAQLQDYLKTAWQVDVKKLTTEHALQPFSRRYFEQNGLVTYAKEWRAAHDNQNDFLSDDDAQTSYKFELEDDFQLKIADLARFMKQPVKAFFRDRLNVIFSDNQTLSDDEEPFDINGLDYYFLAKTVLQSDDEPEPFEQIKSRMVQKVAQLARCGQLPMGLMGQQWQQQLIDELMPVRAAWLNLCAFYAKTEQKLPIHIQSPYVQLHDWQAPIWQDAEEQKVWLELSAGNVLDKKSATIRIDKMIEGWIRQLTAAAMQQNITGYLVARDAVVTFLPIDYEQALPELMTLLEYWRKGHDFPLPTACKTAIAMLQQKDAAKVFDGDGFYGAAEGDDPCIQRLWQSFDDLVAEPEWHQVAQALYQPLIDYVAQYIQFSPLILNTDASTETLAEQA